MPIFLDATICSYRKQKPKTITSAHLITKQGKTKNKIKYWESSLSERSIWKIVFTSGELFFFSFPVFFYIAGFRHPLKRLPAWQPQGKL